MPVTEKSTSQRPDEAGAAAVLASDRLEELVRHHSPYVAGLAYRLLGSDADVDDVVQDVFVALLRFHGAVRDANALRGWLATTTVRLSQRRLRTRSLRLRHWFGLEEFEPRNLPAQGPTAEEHLALVRVHRALDTVSVGARVAWILRYLEQERMEDVARLTGCSLRTAKRRVQSAQVAVKRALSDD